MSKYTMPPRQKMINLLYVILIAMLAINISSDVLEGYKVMNEDFAARIAGLEVYNDSLLARIAGERPESQRQVSEELAERMRKLRATLDGLREEIARSADKDEYEPGKIKAGDDLNAVPGVFLAATTGKGRDLRESVGTFKAFALAHVADASRHEYADSYLRLDDPSRGVSWEKATFSYLPAIGGITFLNKLEEEVLLTVNEVYRSVLYDDGEDGISGHYVLINEGQHVVNEDGTVDGPVVLLSPSESVLYRQYENPLNIFCAGIPMDRLLFSMKNGRIYRKGEKCFAIPDAGSKNAVVYVDCIKEEGRIRLFEYRYQVKSLPNPMPYLVYKDAQGSLVEYRGNIPISKENLQNIVRIGVRVDDGPDIRFNIHSFETVLIKSDSNTVSSIQSTDSGLSAEQRRQIDSMEHGDKFYITSIIVSGSGGVKKQIAPINVVVM